MCYMSSYPPFTEETLQSFRGSRSAYLRDLLRVRNSPHTTSSFLSSSRNISCMRTRQQFITRLRCSTLSACLQDSFPARWTCFVLSREHAPLSSMVASPAKAAHHQQIYNRGDSGRGGSLCTRNSCPLGLFDYTFHGLQSAFAKSCKTSVKWQKTLHRQPLQSFLVSSFGGKPLAL